MQVAHEKDHITHAVIGGAETIDFGISTSAEFFNILSSTLYKDQILAVVRETLCNEWDAHIEAGITHIPVEVTLTEDKFTIRDFGTGIHRDDMGMIYGTYGNSTKKNDGKQTGGFGLGCKAPFAYTDHFEVVSNHDGVKTIYNLSKSSAQAMGKPGIVPIASFPTKDTGLQVSMHINNRQDYNRFMSLTRRIAKNGDMNVTINGEPVQKLGFDIDKANYLVTMEDNVLLVPTPIMVRYGNVVYPVDQVPELYLQYEEIKKHLATLKVMRSEYRIIFQAPPHSISVTPSRESLSMQEHTVNTLKGLFAGFLATLQTSFKEACNEFAEAAVENAIVDVRVGDLLTTSEQLPLKGDKTNPIQITDLLTMAQRYMESNYPQSLDFRKKDLTFRLKSMVTGGLLERGIVQTFLRAMEKVEVRFRSNRERTDWLQRRIIGPVVSKLYAAGMEHNRLFVYDPEDCNSPKSYYNNNQPPIIAATKACPGHLFGTLPYLRNIVVLATSKRELTERAYKHQVFKELGKYPGFLFYHVGMKKADRENALKFFEASGMNIVDLTEKQPWEVDLISRGFVTPAAPRKPVKKGAISLNSIKYGKGDVSTRLSRSDDAPRILKPEFVVAISVRNDERTDRFGRWDEKGSRYIVDLFGDKGAITVNSAVHAKWIKNGVKEFDDYVFEHLANFMMTNPNIQEYWAFNGKRAIEASNIGRYNSVELAKTIYASPLLRAEFGLINNLTEDETKYVYLWEYLMKNSHRVTFPDGIMKVAVHLKAIPLHKANTQLLDKFRDNLMLDLIDEVGVARVLKEQKPDSPQAKKAVQILTLVLNK